MAVQRDVRVERVHDEVREHPEGAGAVRARFLVDRLWPRGVRKSALEGVAWLKDAAPSQALRTWFAHDPSRFEVFAERYRDELRGRPEVLEPLLAAARRGPVTLLYAARDTEHNHALVLRDHVRGLLAGGSN
ncbi:uncharacterized protein YeaO (DUF488 family) [Nocardiopsis sp. Huas11]|uniref:DUF488 domain-containing protein n=1 Tax=Nocardiopsis sp. Huas11 TaxID=2183912 RepID=UPI000EB42C56|nr:DUF488 family protein [Nocardiopsis sp. Huas11]RKS07720.1 uncharacterized protein YeaO (DUF488 family) [Nocardiopsis sp. Huas11]